MFESGTAWAWAFFSIKHDARIWSALCFTADTRRGCYFASLVADTWLAMHRVVQLLIGFKFGSMKRATPSNAPPRRFDKSARVPNEPCLCRAHALAVEIWVKTSITGCLRWGNPLSMCNTESASGINARDVTKVTSRVNAACSWNARLSLCRQTCTLENYAPNRTKRFGGKRGAGYG